MSRRSVPRSRGRRGVHAVAILAALLMIAASAVPAFAGPTWSVVASPSPLAPPGGAVTSVACATTTTCFAVGNSLGSDAFIEQYNGTAWSLASFPSPPGTTALFKAVTCSGPTSCFAAGRADAIPARTITPLIEQWDGTSWSLMPMPSGAGAGQFSAVTCATTTFCLAVGGGVIERWNGTAWSVVPNPAPANLELRGVACATTTSCFAVGSNDFGPSSTLFAESWNGTAWSIAKFPNPGTVFSKLQAVACASPTSCFMVGYTGQRAGFQSKTLIERWNGTTWSIISSPNATGQTSSLLNGVTCVTATNCFAVGSFNVTIGFTGGTLVERWNGTKWAVVPSPNPIATRDVHLAGVTCATASLCFAGGDAQETFQSLLEKWNGSTWSIEQPPIGSSASQLLATTCPTATTCFAVGSNRAGPGTQSLIEQGNGTTWTIMPSPNPAGDSPSDVVLNGVACATPTSCFAVGTYTAANIQPTELIEHWNGSTWGIVKAPVPTIPHSPHPFASGQTLLQSISCPSATSCFAVGYYDGVTGYQALIEHWSGSTWTVQDAPSAGTRETELSGVSCASPVSCFAVGRAQSATLTRTFVDQWNGTKWAIVPSPNPIPSFSQLTGVSCATTTSCAAIGSSISSKKLSALIERWNGTKWAVVTPPGLVGSGLNGVSCPTPTNCLSVGVKGATSKPIAEQMNGTTWSAVAIANPASGQDVSLDAVSCPSSAACTAVGFSEIGNNMQTLVEQYG